MFFPLKEQYPGVDILLATYSACGIDSTKFEVKYDKSFSWYL